MARVTYESRDDAGHRRQRGPESFRLAIEAARAKLPDKPILDR
jgi:hypothetical protein